MSIGPAPAPVPAPAPLAVSLGDPAGIGPELIALAWSRRRELNLPPFFAVGGATLLQAAGERCGVAVPTRVIGASHEAAAAFADSLPVFGLEDGDYRPGKPDRHGAALAVFSLEEAVRAAQQGRASGVVTAPVSKARLAEVGFAFPGQTEFLAARCGVAPDDAVMMLAGPHLRTVPLTVHCALADVPGRLSVGLVLRRTRIVAQALRTDFGVPRPRIAIAALNPHAGENGRFGDEEQRIIAPAVDALRRDGLDVTGPHPADALFTPRVRARFDAAVCMYHDQALIPLKALDFDAGVNVTLGLPLVRTSPDHGTAFDIAGRGMADPGATVAAIRMAGECAARRAAVNWGLAHEDTKMA